MGEQLGYVMVEGGKQKMDDEGMVRSDWVQNWCKGP